MKILIVGGVAGGARHRCPAAPQRRKPPRSSCLKRASTSRLPTAACPTTSAGAITEREALQLQTPEAFHARFNVDVRVQSEVLSVNSAEKTVAVKNHATGEIYTESYDALVLSPALRPPAAL